MSTLTTNYSLIKPAVNNATDQDLWGAYLNTNMDTIDIQMLLSRDFKKRAISTTDSVVAGDRHKILVCDATAAPFTLTLLDAATAGDGFTVVICKVDATANAVTIDGYASETIGEALTYALSGGGDAVTIVCDGVDWHFAGAKTTPSAVASATTTAQGIIEIATDAEAITGTDAVRALTPANLTAVLAALTTISASGGKIVLDDITVQFGTISAGATTGTVTFGTAFSATPWVYCQSNFSANVMYAITTPTRAANNFTYYHQQGAGYTGSWLAIGAT